MKPTLSQVCTLNSNFDTDIEEYAAGGCHSIETWFTKLEDYVESYSSNDVKALLEQHGVKIHVASFQGGLFTNQEDSRETAWKLFDERLELCQELGIETIVVAFDVLPPIGQADIELAQKLLAEAAASAGEHGVNLAIEPQARSAFGNNLQTMAALIEQVGSPHLGVCLDLFHFYAGPSKFSDLSYYSASNLFHVQLCDLADSAREFATDSDRILPGDGDFDIESIVQFLQESEYKGCVSIELMNPQIWQVSSRQFSEIGIAALNKFFKN
ncbi:MAG: sugar phosphate isomerase/epimerase [Planctomycetales bacterium]|nr:sugar phosphate isomerase/epimerase [Planctomycetales bacterium]